MKNIWFKQVVMIEKTEYVLSESDYTDSIAEQEQDNGKMSKSEILNSIAEDEGIDFLD